MVLVVSRLRGRRSWPIYPSPPPHLSIAKSSTPSTYTEASHNFGTAGSASNSFWHHPVTKRPPSTHAYRHHLPLRQNPPPLLPGQFIHHCCHYWYLHHHPQGQYHHHCHWCHHQKLACILSAHARLCRWATSSTNATSSPIPSSLPLFATTPSLSLVQHVSVDAADVSATSSVVSRCHPARLSVPLHPVVGGCTSGTIIGAYLWHPLNRR